MAADRSRISHLPFLRVGFRVRKIVVLVKPHAATNALNIGIIEASFVHSHHVLEAGTVIHGSRPPAPPRIAIDD
jgi:hypothetical protein